MVRPVASSRDDEIVRDRWGERLPRKLGLGSASAFVITATIGAGIFRVPATVASELRDPGPVLLAWLLGAAITLCGALSLAELGAAFPRSGGLFAFMFEAYGPLPAFAYGWAELTVIGPASMAAVATIFAEYLGYFLPLGEWGVRAVAAGALFSVGLLNYLGVRPATFVNSLTTAAKYGGLLILVVLAFAAGNGSADHFLPLWTGGVRSSIFVSALVAVMFCYDGWADLVRVAGEVEQPEKNLPRALLLGSALIAFIYLAVNLAYIYLVPLSEMAGARLIAALTAERIRVLGQSGAAVIAALVMISSFGNIAAGATSWPRTQFAMADRGQFIAALARVSPRFKSPSIAIWVVTAFCVAYALVGGFQQLAERFILGLWPFYALDVVAVFVLRRRRPDLARPYRVVGYPIVPIFFLLASAALILNALWTDPLNTAITFAIASSGIPVYLLRKQFLSSRASAKAPLRRA